MPAGPEPAPAPDAETWTRIGAGDEVLLETLPGAGVARLTLNRPEKRNALNQAVLEQMLDALETLRQEEDVRIVVTRGAGPSFCSGMDLFYLQAYRANPPSDWDKPTLLFRVCEALRNYPKVTLAQVHGYCVGGGLALLNAHDLALAASSAQIGMPEVIRGSFGQIATSTLFHAGIPMKLAAFLQLTGRNFSGAEAARVGLVSMAVDEACLEAETLTIAREIGSRHPGTLAHAKIAVQFGRDLTLNQAMRLDELVTWRQRAVLNPLEHVGDYLASQSSGPNTAYKRPDV